MPVLHSHAKELFPMITKKVTATIQWDGPKSFQEFETSLREREVSTANKKTYQYTILHPRTSEPVGSIDIRPERDFSRADIGLWIGEKHHGQGIGTKAIEAITEFGFNELNLTKIEAFIFKGNNASKIIFEKCGYIFEGIIPERIEKRGKKIDEWVFGITKQEWSQR